MERCSGFNAYRMSDALWERLETLLPKYKVNCCGGRPCCQLRRVADVIFYRLRTGCQWKAIPPSLVSGSTAHQYFQEWVRHGVFDKLWQLALYHEFVGFDWLWQSLDGAITKAPLGQELTGPNPTDQPLTTHHSFWIRDMPVKQRFPTLEGTHQTTIAIIGGGITGLSTGIELLECGYKVTV